MTTRVNFNAATPHGRLLARAVDRLITGESDLERVKKAMDAMSADTGGGATWAQVEAELGVAAGQGQTIYNLIDNALSAINVAAVRQAMIRLDQG